MRSVTHSVSANRAQRSLSFAKISLRLCPASHAKLIGARTLRGVDTLWRSLAVGVEAQDVDARIQARPPKADTFERRIVVYRRRLRVSATPEGVIDLVLLAKGGRARMLSIRGSGELAGSSSQKMQKCREHWRGLTSAIAPLGREAA